MKVRDILAHIKDGQRYGHYMIMYFNDLDKDYEDIEVNDLEREKQGLPNIANIIREFKIDITQLEIEKQYNTIAKDLRGKDARLSTLVGLRDVAIDVVDIQNSVKAFIEDQFDKISNLYDEFWEKNPKAEKNPFDNLLNLFTVLRSYADENDFEDINSGLEKALKRK